MPPTLDQPPVRPNPDVLVQRLGQEVILLHLRTNRFFDLNRTAARLWELLSEGHSRSRIEEQVLKEFDVPAVQLAREIDAFLSELLAEDLVIAHATP
jgi:hypothetical protein